MGSALTWYASSWQHMASRYARVKAEGFDAAAIAKAIDKRSGYADKARLEARKDFFRKHNIPLRSAKRPPPDLLT